MLITDPSEQPIFQNSLGCFVFLRPSFSENTDLIYMCTDAGFGWFRKHVVYIHTQARLFVFDWRWVVLLPIAGENT